MTARGGRLRGSGAATSKAGADLPIRRRKWMRTSVYGAATGGRWGQSLNRGPGTVRWLPHMELLPSVFIVARTHSSSSRNLSMRVCPSIQLQCRVLASLASGLSQIANVITHHREPWNELRPSLSTRRRRTNATTQLALTATQLLSKLNIPPTKLSCTWLRLLNNSWHCRKNSPNSFERLKFSNVDKLISSSSSSSSSSSRHHIQQQQQRRRQL